MAFNWICITFTLLLCLGICAWAAPLDEESSKYNELERTLKELATTVLAMSGAADAPSYAADDAGYNFENPNVDVLGSEAADALMDLHELRI